MFLGFRLAKIYVRITHGAARNQSLPYLAVMVVQVEVFEQYANNDRCFNLTDVPVFFLDGGMDTQSQCGAGAGGCALSYSFNETVNTTIARGVQFGPFEAGKPNLAKVCALCITREMETHYYEWWVAVIVQHAILAITALLFEASSQGTLLLLCRNL